MADMEDKVVVVTGSARGLGKVIAERLYKNNAKIAIVDIDKDASEATAENLGENAIGIECDVSDRESVELMAKQVIEKFKKVDILVNNAGITKDSSLKKMTDEQWDQVLRVNLKSVFLCTQILSKYMKENGWGRVINMSSLAGVAGNFGQTNYSAAKSGMIGLTKTLSKELGRKNITVNAIAPGFMDTEMVKSIPDNIVEQMLLEIPLGRKGRPEEVAAGVEYLASEDAGFVNGHVLNINGGAYV